MFPAPSSKGHLLLSENSDVDRPDAGIVIGIGDHPRAEDGKSYDIEVGDQVLVMPYSGIWFRDLILDGLKLWEVRFYGIADVDEYESEREDVLNNIVSTIGEDYLHPKGEWVLLKRDAVNDESEGGILLTDGSAFRTQKATVMAVGPECDSIVTGDRVIYHGPAQHVGLKGLLDLYPNLEGKSEDYSLIKQSGIYCVIES